MKQKQGLPFPILKSEPADTHNFGSEELAPSPGPLMGPEGTPAPGDAEAEVKANPETVLMEEDLQCLAGYDAGRYSTQLLSTQELPLDTHL